MHWRILLNWNPHGDRPSFAIFEYVVYLKIWQKLDDEYWWDKSSDCCLNRRLPSPKVKPSPFFFFHLLMQFFFWFSYGSFSWEPIHAHTPKKLWRYLRRFQEQPIDTLVANLVDSFSSSPTHQHDIIRDESLTVYCMMHNFSRYFYISHSTIAPNM